MEGLAEYPMDFETLGNTPISEDSPPGQDIAYEPEFEELQQEIRETVDRIRRLALGVARHERHREQATAFREAFTAMGLELFAERNEATEYSNTLTGVSLPAHTRENPEEFFDAVEARGVSISGGQAHLGGEIFRVSNMGNLSSEQILRGVRTIGEAFEETGEDVDTEAGIEAARSELR